MHLKAVRYWPDWAPDRPLHLLMDRAYEGNETR